jgi:hypothetical protein
MTRLTNFQPKGSSPLTAWFATKLSEASGRPKSLADEDSAAVTSSAKPKRAGCMSGLLTMFG